MEQVTIKIFKKIIKDYFKKAKRSFPWRETSDPYRILVSEIMLQQTQSSRVIVKYEQFIKRFPDIKTLAGAKTAEVLEVWFGLGYNRRALALKRLAEVVVKEHNGEIPNTFEKIIQLPGIGPYTAGAILAFAFNKPRAIIETNIRTVFIYFFFPNKTKVDDRELMPLIQKTLSRTNPREWYWALMDYGSMLKRTGFDKGKVSKHYLKQSKFKGSGREVRGKILRLLKGHRRLTKVSIEKQIFDEKGRVSMKLEELCTEGFIVKYKSFFALA